MSHERLHEGLNEGLHENLHRGEGLEGVHVLIFIVFINRQNQSSGVIR